MAQRFIMKKRHLFSRVLDYWNVPMQNVQRLAGLILIYLFIVFFISPLTCAPSPTPPPFWGASHFIVLIQLPYTMIYLYIDGSGLFLFDPMPLNMGPRDH